MSSLRRLAWSAAVLGSAVMFGACGDSEENKTKTPTELCEEVARTECGRLYESCITDADRVAFGLTVPYAGCVLGLAAQLLCASATADRICAGAQPSYPTASAEKCIQEARAPSCETIKANGLNFTVYAPSCAQCLPSPP